VAALVGHTALRSNHLDRLDRSASPMKSVPCAPNWPTACRTAHWTEQRAGLCLGLQCRQQRSGTTGCRTGRFGGIYTTHLRSEFEPVLEAMDEAWQVGRHANSPVIVSHMKCAGKGNWGRSPQLLASLENAARQQQVGCDCYPTRPAPPPWT
jgi:N-acyl-D-aspartate/D-glutamate deacylase